MNPRVLEPDLRTVRRRACSAIWIRKPHQESRCLLAGQLRCCSLYIHRMQVYGDARREDDPQPPRHCLFRQLFRVHDAFCLFCDTLGAGWHAAACRECSRLPFYFYFQRFENRICFFSDRSPFFFLCQVFCFAVCARPAKSLGLMERCCRVVVAIRQQLGQVGG